MPTFALAILLCLVMAGNGIRPQAASAQGGLTAKRLLPDHNAIAWYDGLSSDGQWVEGTDWGKGGLVLTCISTGEIRRLVPGNEDPAIWRKNPVLSPDQKQVAYFSDLSGMKVMPNQLGAKSREVLPTSDSTLSSTPSRGLPMANAFWPRCAGRASRTRSLGSRWRTSRFN